MNTEGFVFRGQNQIAVVEVPGPRAGYGMALLQVTMATICDTDVDVFEGEHPVRLGLMIAREAVRAIN